MKTQPLSKTYEGKTVLDVPALTFFPGKIHALIGANGSGKSTLCKLLAGVIKADERKSPFEPPIQVRYLPQKSCAFRMSVEKNLLLSSGSTERAEKLMARLGILHLKGQPARRLSGGETARMALARILMQPAELLILDEPCAAMDMESTLLSEALIREYCEETRCAVLIVTHSLQQARRLAHRAFFLHQGKLLEAGDAEQMLLAPEKAETRRFLTFFGG